MTIRGILKRTDYFRRYWKNRKIDWQEHYFTPEHPHRKVIIDKLKQFRFRSILEVGCAAGANLYRIKQEIPNSDIGGIDWNEDAINKAKELLPRSSILQVGEASDIYISDRGSDIILSDMCYIYLDRKNFKKALKELKRVARIGIILCEFHHKSWLKRFTLKLSSGYNAYDYEKELKRMGFSDIGIYKLKDEDWSGEPQKTYGCIITAKV